MSGEGGNRIRGSHSKLWVTVLSPLWPILLGLITMACSGKQSTLPETSSLDAEIWATEDIEWLRDQADTTAPLYTTSSGLLYLRKDHSLQIIAAAFGQDQGSDSIWVSLSQPTTWIGTWAQVDSHTVVVCYRLTGRFIPISEVTPEGKVIPEKIPGDLVIDTIRIEDSAGVIQRLHFWDRVYAPGAMLDGQTLRRLLNRRVPQETVRQAQEVLLRWIQ